jgi:hypothetical protein
MLALNDETVIIGLSTGHNAVLPLTWSDYTSYLSDYD